MTLARTPYARLSPADIGQVDRELKKLEQMSAGLYVPKVLVHARSPYTVQGTDTMLLCDCTAGPITLTFPLAARVDGMSVQVVKSDTSTNAVTLTGTFSGVASPTLTVQDSGFTVVAMNGSYHVTAFVPSPIVPGETGVTSIVYDYDDPRRFGATGVAGTDARAAFAATDVAAVAGYGANGEVTPHGGTHRLASNLTITSPFDPLPKAIVKPDSGVTLTLSGAVTAGPYQWFDSTAGGSLRVKPGASRYLYPEWFGADPSGTNDSTVAWQAALDTAIASNVVLGADITIVASGSYKITNSLHGFLWTTGTFSFCTFHIESARGYIAGKQVGLVPTFTDRPALILQAARSVKISGMSFTGALTQVFPTNLQTLSDTGGSAGTPWYNSGNVGRDSQYSPYCAVAIDPFSNGLPSDGGIPGHSAFYTQNIGSSVVTFESCLARQFIVAWAVSLSPSSQQADTVMFRDCTEENVKVAFAIGETQNRNVTVQNTHVLYARTVFDTRTYGQQGGEMPNVIGGLVAGACKWLMIAGNSFGAALITGFYAESLWSLGQWKGGYTFTFADCHFALVPPGTGGNCSSHLDTAGPVIFRGGFFGWVNNNYGRVSINTNGGVLFDAVQLIGDPVLPRYANIKFRDAKLRFSGIGQSYGITDSLRDYLPVSNPNADVIMPPFAEAHETFGSGPTYRRVRWNDSNYGPVFDAAAVITVSAGSATFTSASTALKAQVGDVVVNYNTNAAWAVEKFVPADATVNPTNIAIGTVQSIVGNVITLQDVPNGFGSGTYNIGLQQLPHYKPRTIGITTSGSNVIASVFPSPTMWRVGDRINGTNIPAACYVTAVSTGSATITISQNATGSSTAEVYDVRMFCEEASASVQPASDVWFKGDFVKNTGGAKDGNNMIPTGWRCTVSGRGDGTAPGATFETIYGSTVTPAT